MSHVCNHYRQQRCTECKATREVCVTCERPRPSSVCQCWNERCVNCGESVYLLESAGDGPNGWMHSRDGSCAAPVPGGSWDGEVQP